MTNVKVNKLKNLPHDRYIAALERMKAQIEAGSKLVLDDSDVTGDKHNSASWGMCSDDKLQWPDAEDHIWPDQFESHGRVAPLTLGKKDPCPFDARMDDPKSAEPLGFGYSCFYSCRLFQAQNAKHVDGGRHRRPNREPNLPSRGMAVELYQIALKRAQK